MKKYIKSVDRVEIEDNYKDGVWNGFKIILTADIGEWTPECGELEDGNGWEEEDKT